MFGDSRWAQPLRELMMTLLRASDLLLIIGVLGFVGFNFYLWSRPITQFQLFLISLPLGLGAFAGFIWCVGRK